MSTFFDILKQIDQMQKRIEAYGAFPPEVKKKLQYKFRLDWNYYSNSMEGNTLTRAETRDVMIGVLNVEGKPLKDVLEMKGHNDVVESIMRLGKGEQRISEKRIKEIHKGIIHEDDLERREEIGQWKKVPNHIINYKNEKFNFAEPEEVADKIQALLDWLNAGLDKIKSGKKDAPHPLELIFQFHLDYLTIHPFQDGNGRTARILTNLLLISFDYPVLIIRNEDKDAYYSYLGDIQGYGGKPDLLFAFMGKLLLRSQQVVLDALEGKEIEEPDDIDKKLTLFVLEETAVGSIGALKSTNELRHGIYATVIKPLFNLLEEKHHVLDALFVDNVYFRSANDGNISSVNIDSFEDGLSKLLENKEGDNSIYNLALTIRHHAYQNNGMNMFTVQYQLTVYFGDYQYTIQHDDNVLASYTYNRSLEYAGIEAIVSKFVNENLDDIKRRIKRE